MAKVIGVCKVNNVEELKFNNDRGENVHLIRCECLTDDGMTIIFSRPASESPKPNDMYQMILSRDSKLKPVIRYEKEK